MFLEINFLVCLTNKATLQLDVKIKYDLITSTIVNGKLRNSTDKTTGQQEIPFVTPSSKLHYATSFCRCLNVTSCGGLMGWDFPLSTGIEWPFQDLPCWSNQCTVSFRKENKGYITSDGKRSFLSMYYKLIFQCKYLLSSYQSTLAHSWS